MPQDTQPCCALEITVRERPDAAPRRHTLRCDPPGGDHPDVAGACALLHRDDDLFAPVPRGTFSAQVYGGPQQATVTGVHRSRPVNAHFDRRDAARTARWNRAVPVLPDVTAR